MGFYKKYKDEIKTLHLVSQILGKIKLEYAVQEPQWAHTMLDITTTGFSTGLLKFNDSYFQVEADLVKDKIIIKTKEENREVKFEDGKTIKEYYNEIMDAAADMGLALSIQTKPQEMEWKTPFEEDTQHHHYKGQAASEILEWFQFAWDLELEFIGPLRQRKVYPGLFWGTFDLATILVYNKFEAFPDDSKIIERAAFDEHMVEFGFWLGDDSFEHPTFFILPYPFVENVELEVDDTFPAGSYFSPKMAEYLYEMKDGIDQAKSNADEVIRFFDASCKKSMEYLEWKETDYYFQELKMEKNKKK